LGADGPDAVALGQIFVRYGIAGFEDVGVGAKVRIAQGVGGRADVSVQGLLTAPTGSDGVSSEEWIPTLVALTDVGLGGSAAMGVNLGFRKGSGDVADQGFASVTPSVSVAEGLSAYAGWAGSFADGGNVHWLEGGMAFLAGPDLQFDLNAATSPDTDQWFVGVGMAVRTGVR
jgi:hypothetical protein